MRKGLGSAGNPNNGVVYVLHEFGAPSHYRALKRLLEEHGATIRFHELNLLAQAGSIYKKRGVARLVGNICFLASLPFKRRSAIVLGLAPCSRKLRWLRRVLTRHDVFYHTSHVDWSGRNWIHEPQALADEKLWKHWIHDGCRAVFAVSQAAKRSLVENGFDTETRVHVVWHSFDCELGPNDEAVSPRSFLCVSRLERSKGIEELLRIFSGQPRLELTIAGGGSLAPKVEAAAKAHENIHYVGQITGLERLRPIYQRHAFLLQNSKRTGAWEELFGMSIVEGMACGCVPVATDHAGPKEIISEGINGFLVREGEIESKIAAVAALPERDYRAIRAKAIADARKYSSESVAIKWSPVLKAL